MNPKTRRALVQLSIPTDLIDKIGQLGHTIANLRSFSAAQLEQHYAQDEAELIAGKIKREPIEDSVIEAVLAASGEACIYCADGNCTRPYEVHHIVPYASSQDNSEDNLALVCPSHHVWIHKTDESTERQKARRREWHATVQLGRAYAEKGLSFPYGHFEPIDYASDNRPFVAVELLTGAPLGPVAARLLSAQPLADEARRRLTKHNFLLIVGRSGSGKTTLAAGIAGGFANEGAFVFRYRRPYDGDSRQILKEVLTFLGLTVAPCVLILDDINTWASGAELEQIAAASSEKARILATCTGGRLVDDPVAELHVVGRIGLHWEDLRDASVAVMLAQEDQVVPILRGLREAEHHPIGFGASDRSLSSMIRAYAQTAQSAWEFLFLLRGAWVAIRDDLGALIANDRADVPVLCAAIEQIAGFERPVSVAEVVRLTAELLEADGALITERWVADVFEHQVQRRRIVRVRDAYTTVHREWARALICCALADSRAQSTARKLLAREFDIATKSPRRLVILWSWLQNDAQGQAFVRDWLNEQDPAGWCQFFGTAVANGLADASMVARQLHMAFHWPQWARVVGDAFEANEVAIAAVVHGTGHEDWNDLQDLVQALNHSRPELVARVVKSWPPESAAGALSRAHPDQFKAAWSVLSDFRKHNPAWCDDVGRAFDWNALAANFARVRTGDLMAFFEVDQMLQHLRVPLLRSRTRQLTRAMTATMTGASLTDIHYWVPLGLLWLELYSEDVRAIVGALNPEELAAEISVAIPRHWGRLAMLSDLADRHGSDFPRRLIDSLGEKFVENVNRFGAASAYEFRCLLWQLTYGSVEQTRKLAQELLPLAVKVCESAVHEADAILRAYATLDPGCGQSLCVRLGRTFSGGIKGTKRDGLLRRGTHDHLVADLEASGQDYDVTKVMLGDGAERAGSDDSE